MITRNGNIDKRCSVSAANAAKARQRLILLVQEGKRALNKKENPEDSESNSDSDIVSDEDSAEDEMADEKVDVVPSEKVDDVPSENGAVEVKEEKVKKEKKVPIPKVKKYQKIEESINGLKNDIQFISNHLTKPKEVVLEQKKELPVLAKYTPTPRETVGKKVADLQKQAMSNLFAKK